MRLEAKEETQLIGVDLFSGAGGMSLGASLAGVDVKLAVELDRDAAKTYSYNHPSTEMLRLDVRKLNEIPLPKTKLGRVLFAGPPCQGFSTSNQRTRGIRNVNNHLCFEFIRIVETWLPEWILFENVKGLVETAEGQFRKHIIESLERMGYTCSDFVLCSADYGVPQIRWRYFLVGSIDGKVIEKPPKTEKHPVTVSEAIRDLPRLENGASTDYLLYGQDKPSSYGLKMRQDLKGAHNNLVTQNSEVVIRRYSHIPQGGNWESIPFDLMESYSDFTRCHTGIYRRLSEHDPSVVLGNYRKNMLIHPTQDRGLSVREAARLQSFPDSYRFFGSIGFQQQQVANAVPPLLAKAVFSKITSNLTNRRSTSKKAMVQGCVI